MKEEGLSPDGFMFVNYDARTKGQGPEAPLRSIKRSHVTRQHYRKVRRERMEAWSSSSGESSVDSSVGNPGLVPVSNKKSRAQPATQSTRDFHQPQIANERADEDLRYEGGIVSPQTMLGQGRLDPFKLFPAENVPVLVQKLLDHGKNPQHPQDVELNKTSAPVTKPCSMHHLTSVTHVVEQAWPIKVA